MIDIVKNEFFGKYTDFKGRTDRKTLWLCVLGIFLLSMVIGFVLGFLGGILGDTVAKLLSFLVWIYEIAIIIPSLAIEVRRLHDTGKSGWWILISLVPIAGPIILLVLLCMDSK